MEQRNRRRAAQAAVDRVVPQRERIQLTADNEQQIRALMEEFGIGRRQAIRRFRHGAVYRQHDHRVLQRIAAIRGVDLIRARQINAERGYIRLADFGIY